jgi:hypothetical protein
MVLQAKWLVSNITKLPVSIVRVSIIPPQQDGSVLVLRPSRKSFGKYAIQGNAATEVLTNFQILPALVKVGERFAATVLMYDQYGNEHDAKVSFSPKVPQKPKPDQNEAVAV